MKKKEKSYLWMISSWQSIVLLWIEKKNHPETNSKFHVRNIDAQNSTRAEPPNKFLYLGIQRKDREELDVSSPNRTWVCGRGIKKKKEEE